MNMFSNISRYPLIRRSINSRLFSVSNNIKNAPTLANNHSTTMPKFPDPIIIDNDANATIIDNKEVKQDEIKQEAIPTHHYLDTMKIYNDLLALEFTAKQSDLILSLLKQNLTTSLDKFQSKILTNIELENESYLFEAAQSELRVEIKASRELDLRQLENEKFLLEILLNEEQDSLNKNYIMSKNDSQVVINDQISENTLLQKKIKRRMQDLNSRISTEINGDIKSDIEGLRWHTTRSGLMAVLVLVFSVMGGVSISKRINKDEGLQQVILRTVEQEHEEIDDDDESINNLREKDELTKKELLKELLKDDKEAK